MTNELIAKLNPELLNDSCIEDLNKLTKEEIKKLHDLYPQQMKGRAFLRVELFKKGVSAAKTAYNYLGLANQLYLGNYDSFQIYGIVGVTKNKINLSAKPIEKASPIKTAFSDVKEDPSNDLSSEDEIEVEAKPTQEIDENDLVEEIAETSPNDNEPKQRGRKRKN